MGRASGAEIVVDASVVVAYAMSEERFSGAARRFLRDVAGIEALLLAPPLIEAETDSALRRRVTRGVITPEAERAAHAVVDALAIETVHDPGVRRDARTLATRFGQGRVYDSTYAALAQLRGCELWTADSSYFRAVRRGLPFVRHLEEFDQP